MLSRAGPPVRAANTPPSQEPPVSRIVAQSRFLILVPIAGLALAAAFLFLFGGILLIVELFRAAGDAIGAIASGGVSHDAAAHGDLPFVVTVVEYVHLFLIGTVLYITAVGLYQLFVSEIDFPLWLRIDSTEELETSLIGVTVVVLAVNFMGATYSQEPETFFWYGAGIALPIAALGLFVGLRTWATAKEKRLRMEREQAGLVPDEQEEPPG